MIARTILSIVDQGVLSAVAFLFALALIHNAPAAEYGLYVQLLNLQSLFSPVHAGVFVSGFLAVYVRKNEGQRRDLAVFMARKEWVIGLPSAIFVATATYTGAAILRAPISLGLAAASAAALLGLWWREFVRALYFGGLNMSAVLKLDVVYALAAAGLLAVLVLTHRLSVTLAFAVAAVAAVATSSFRLAQLWATPARDGAQHASDWREAWALGKWDIIGSFVTWIQAQTYVYFAAAAGGLEMAGAVAAARLLGAPLALSWVAYSNLLRVSATRLAGEGDIRGLRHEIRRSIVFVLGVSALYAALLIVTLPVIDRVVFEHKFAAVNTVAPWWLAYFTLTGLTTMAASFLRGALLFSHVFRLYVISCCTAIVALLVSTRLAAAAAPVIALAIAECIPAALMWRDVVRLVNDANGPLRST